MALTRTEISFYLAALKLRLLPPGMHILELGESELLPAGHGGQLLGHLAGLIDAPRVAEAERLLAAAAAARSEYQRFFGPARALYHAIFQPASYTAIDLARGPRRYCVDLNGPVNLGAQFDCVINNGTTEHIFDQAAAYRTIHEHTRPGGLMLHFTPSIGWINHGLYNVQPGFFFDLAKANGYETTLIGLLQGDIFAALAGPEHLGEVLRSHPALFANGELCALLRKTSDEPFRNPLQGMYAHQQANLEMAQTPRRWAVKARRNLALSRPALQSSTSRWSWHDDPAVDAAGGNNGRITGSYSFCTDEEHDPWWMVDLGDSVAIDEVVVHNRLDDPAAARRAAGLAIQLSDDGQNWRNIYARRDDTAFGGADGRPLCISLAGRSGRYVRVLLPGRTILALDEIEVY
jgi:SAM-dependent methyltransferase